MKLERAIEIVLELARENVLDPKLCDEEDAEETRAKQVEACGVVEDFFVNVVFEGRLKD